jgi:hypothetical protein
MTRVTTPATSLDLVSLDQVKTLLNIPLTDTSHDALLAQQITATSRAVNNFCDRIFVVQSYRDQIRNPCGYWGEPLVTRQYPIVLDTDGITPLVTVTESGVALDPALLEVYPDTGGLYRLDDTANPSAWTDPLLVVDYTAGFDPVPEDVQGACLEWLSARFYLVGRDPTLRSETIPDLITQVYGSRSDVTASDIPGGVRDWLIPYKVWTV